MELIILFLATVHPRELQQLRHTCKSLVALLCLYSNRMKAFSRGSDKVVDISSFSFKSDIFFVMLRTSIWYCKGIRKGSDPISNVIVKAFSHHTTRDSESLEIGTLVLDHSLVHSLVHSHCSLIRLLRIARFARWLTHALPSSWDNGIFMSGFQVF